MPLYNILHKPDTTPLTLDWSDSIWRTVQPLIINNFRPESSSHRPTVAAKAYYTDTHLTILFDVQDRYVKSTQTTYQDMVCKDSCVEVFVRPNASKGYVNFEVNAGGTLHSAYIEDCERTENGFKQWTLVDDALGSTVEIKSTLPHTIRNEILEPTPWNLVIAIPFKVLTHYIGEFGALSGASWTANFYKCADDTSHPHWAAWSPVKEFNFHDPESFGTLTFD